MRLPYDMRGGKSARLGFGCCGGYFSFAINIPLERVGVIYGELAKVTSTVRIDSHRVIGGGNSYGRLTFHLP